MKKKGFKRECAMRHFTQKPMQKKVDSEKDVEGSAA